MTIHLVCIHDSNMWPGFFQKVTAWCGAEVEFKPIAVTWVDGRICEACDKKRREVGCIDDRLFAVEAAD